MKSIVKIATIIVLLILVGNKAGQSCSASCTNLGEQKSTALPTNTAVKAVEKHSFISIIYSPGINF